MVLPAIVHADVVAHDVALPGGRACVLAEQVARADVVAGVVVLQDGVGDPAIEVKTAPVVAGALVVVRVAVLDHDPIRVPGPDAHRPIPPPRHIPPVVEGFAVLDGASPHVAHHDAVAAVVLCHRGAPRVVLGDAVTDIEVSGEAAAG